MNSSEISISNSTVINSSNTINGTTISIGGELTSADPSFFAPNNANTTTFADEYKLEVTVFEQPLTLSLLATGSTPFDTFLQVIDNNTGEVIAFDNDGGDGLNSLISGNDLILQEGIDYRIRVTSFGSLSPSENNAYTLETALSQGVINITSLTSGGATATSNSIADISVSENSPDQVINLSDTFEDLDGDDIAFEVISNTNSNLVTPILNASDLNLDFQDNQSGVSEITIRGTDSDSTIDETFSINVNPESIGSEGFDVQYYRFQNSDLPGTYIFVDGGERASILADPNLENFVEEGNAFKVRSTPGENLVEVNRYQSSQTPGTYLFSTASDFQSDSSITQSDFLLEGLAFYAHGANSGSGNDYYRFENNNRPGTYLFSESGERSSIIANFSTFEDQGTVWAVEA